MGTRPKDGIKAMITKDILDIYNHCKEVKKSLNDDLQDTLDYLNALLAQIPQSTSRPLIMKTPKVVKKRGVQRIETIPENDVVANNIMLSNSTATSNDTMVNEIKSEIMQEPIGRAKRKASQKAASNIKMQQSLLLNQKLRRPSTLNETSTRKNRESRSKRKKSGRDSSDEETMHAPAKHSRREVETALDETETKKTPADGSSQDRGSAAATQIKEERLARASSKATRSSDRKRTFSQSEKLNGVKVDIDDTVIAPMGNDIEEQSMYEDAIGKPTPIMNSTMNFNSTYSKMMNATVVLEPLSAIKLDRTVTINKYLRDSSTGKDSTTTKAHSTTPNSNSKTALQDRMNQLKKAMANKEFDELLTEDESSPDVKTSKATFKKPEAKKQRQKKHQLTRSMTSSEDEILNTPSKPTLKEVNTVTGFHVHKPNALFSPYAKESVKRRVEAFEQVGMSSPKPAIEVDQPIRVTRTKTRAKAAAQAEAAENNTNAVAEKTVAHKLARKSLAKAKKISLAKQNKDGEEYKENKLLSAQKVSKLAPMEKVNLKQQQKTTPLNKLKTQLPMSVNRVLTTTPSNQVNVNKGTTLSAARTNIVTSVESFIQAPRSVSKRNSIDKIEERKRKLNEEDARKKREEALRLQTEERRRKRQEKELKNKLAREAKERLDMEKRQKAEKEREEKARLAQQMQEKQREEIEKKRLAQLQRAQETEERRRHEEQQRLQRLQEQEEAERVLAEQRRKEQEAEKRKEAEVRAQQQAAAEAMKVKNQLMGQTKYGSKHHGPTTYIMDSEPDDDDESDDEFRPKHIIPYWAKPQVRSTQLMMQRYISDRAINKFFDSKKCTPDLSKLFHGIDRNRLKRTSSAIWKTPPRYSMMEAE